MLVRLTLGSRAYLSSLGLGELGLGGLRFGLRYVGWLRRLRRFGNRLRIHLGSQLWLYVCDRVRLGELRCLLGRLALGSRSYLGGLGLSRGLSASALAVPLARGSVGSPGLSGVGLGLGGLGLSGVGLVLVVSPAWTRTRAQRPRLLGGLQRWLRVGGCWFLGGLGLVGTLVLVRGRFVLGCLVFDEFGLGGLGL